MPEFKKEETTFNPQQLEQIYQRFKEKPRADIEAVSKREAVKEIIKEDIQKAAIQAPLSETEEEVLKTKISELKKLSEREKTEALVKVAIKDSILSAVRLAQKLGPYYIDALHDALVDEFLNILIQQKKI